VSAGWWSLIVELVLLALAGGQLVRLRPCVRGTTLTDAWLWCWAALNVAAVVLGVRGFAVTTDDSFAIGDYLIAVMGLTPLMAVLGARRPTCRVWTWFVVLPLIVVLNWPVISVVLARGWFGELSLESPVIVGFALVTVMACGNYFGTALTWPALLWGGLLTALVVRHSSLAPSWWPQVAALRLALGVTAVVGLHRVRRVWSAVSPAADRFDRLWFDVLDRFGVVWARRLQERLNLLGQTQWPGRLDLDGWHWPTAPTDEQLAQLEHAHRWLLRRFVDPPWIDARLHTSSEEPSPLKIDS
jgi:hypothetical protein